MNISVLSQQVSHYTGGRYYAYALAVALSELGHEVTLAVDSRALPFERDYTQYVRPDIAYGFDGRNVPKADLYIGLPITGAVSACMLGKRHRVPSVVCILDIPLMMKHSHHKSVVAMHDRLWSGMRGAIQANPETSVFVLANCNRDPCAKWLGIDRRRIHTIYPAVNHRILNQIRTVKRQDSICWISRIVAHKRFPHVLDVAKILRLSVDVITARPDYRMVHRRDMDHLIHWRLCIPDTEKFDVLSRSAAMVNSSIFEGFGIFLIEALATGTPAVIYELPTYREVVDGSKFEEFVYFAERDNREDLMRQLMRCLREGRAGFKGDTRFNMNRLIRDLGITLQKIL
jgi:glycosyltransferase involved in cell wall biosynthesis